MKRIIAAILSVAMCGTVVSCSKDSSSGEPALTSNGKKVGISLPASFLQRWNNDGEYLKTHFENAGCTVELSFAENDPDKQNEDIKAMIDDDVDLLIVAAVDCESLSDTLSGAKSENIPVVAYDRLILDTDAVTYYVSYDNYAVGKRQAEYVRDQLWLDTTNKSFNIEFVAGAADDYNARCFYDGAYSVLEPYIESGKLNVLSGKTTFEKVATDGWTTENACSNMKKILSSFYTYGTQLDIVLCANDSTALGVIQALDSSYSGSNTPIITGQDADIENIKAIVDGKQSMTVFKNFNDESSVAFTVCDAILTEGTPSANLVDSLSVDVKYDTETYNNGVKYVQSYLLNPAVIDKDNLQILVNSGLYQWDSDNQYLVSTLE